MKINSESSSIVRNFKTIFLAACLFVGPASHAKMLQIIHTNDLHSHMEKGDSDTTGGIAAVKGVIESLKARAASQGIESVVLDAGDFSEGTAFFFADDGRQSWRLMDAMGYDAITLGNHDWLVGGKQMNQIVGAVNPKTPFLAANLKIDDSLPELKRAVRPYVEIQRGGLRIAVLGLTTDEFIYKWRMKGGDIAWPYDIAREEMLDLRRRNDLVIALSHLGYNEDKKLARYVWGLDMIVGGHSHTRLDAPVMMKAQGKKKIPVVQTGEHGDFVGQMIVDVQPGRAMKVISYELVPVTSESPRDPMIAQMVADARTQLEQKFGAEWLYEVIGHSDIDLERPLHGETTWGQISADAMRETADTDFALDIGEFFGESQKSGQVTRESLIQFYPRVFNAKKNTGWTVWTIKVPGWLLRMVLTEVAKAGSYLITSGLSYEIGKDENGNTTAQNIRINGRALNDLKEYQAAVSEGVGRGTLEISILLRSVFKPKDTGMPIWTAMEQKLARMGGHVASPARTLASVMP